MKYTFYVDAKNGNDENSGSKTAPFATAPRAFEAAQTILRAKPADLVLQFKKGDYSATRPLAIDGADFAKGYSLTVRGEKGAAIRGTYDIPARLFKKVEGKEYYSYTLPKEAYIDGKPPKSKAVYFNGDMRDRASSEYTVTDYNETLFVDEKTGEEYYSIFVKEDLLSDLLGAPRPEDGKPSLKCDPNMEMSIVLSWYFSIVRIEGIDYAHSFGSEEEGCHPGYIALRLCNPDGAHFNGNPYYVGRIGDGKHRPFLLYGNLAFLHKGGQYFYNERTGEVYYYPRPEDDMENGVIGVAVCDKLLSFTNMENVTVEGLRLGGTTSDITAGGGLMTGQGGAIRFREYAWWNDAAIYGGNVKNLAVRGCTISDTYYHGIALDGKIEGASITGCDFKNIGATSIAVVPKTTKTPARDVVIENNYSVNSGYVFQNCCGIFVTFVYNMKLCHNSIIDSSYSAISAGLTWKFDYGSMNEPEANLKNVEIAYNYIENPMIRCYDGGAIYVNGGTVDIHKYKTYYNSMHHNYAYCGTPKKGNEKCMLTSTSLYHDEGASHWHTHSNVVWADEETLTAFSYISLQAGDGPCARIFVEDNYILNIKEDYLTCGEGRVDPCRYLREKNSVMLYRGNCPDGFAPVEGSYHETRVNELIRGAGVPGRKNGKPLNLKGYRYKVVGEKPGFNFTAKCDELSDGAFQQFDFPLRWYKFNYGEVRRLGEKYAEDYSDYEIALFAEGRARSVKTLFSSIDTTVGLSEFGLYSGKGKLERAMRFARRVGCESIRIYGGLVPAGDDPAVYYGQSLAAIREYVAMAEENGFELWLTLKNGTAVDSADVALKMLKEIDSEALLLAFNPAEAHRAGLDVMAEYEKLRPYLACIEVTDLDGKGMSVPVGAGVLPYEAILKNLIDTGYGGFVCLSPAFGLFGGKSAILANGRTLNLAGPNRYRMNASYLALKDVMEKIGHPIP